MSQISVVFRLGEHDLDVIFQEGVAVVRAHFGNGVGVIFQALDHNFTLVGVSGHGG